MLTNPFELTWGSMVRILPVSRYWMAFTVENCVVTVEAAVEVPPPVRVPQPNPLERLVRDMTEQLKRDRAEAPRRRLVALKQYGLNQVPWGVPDSWRAKVATALEGYVTLEHFPSWVSDQQAYAFVRGKVDELLQPYRDEVAHEDDRVVDRPNGLKSRPGTRGPLVHDGAFIDGSLPLLSIQSRLPRDRALL